MNVVEGNLVSENKQKRNCFDHAAPRCKINICLFLCEKKFFEKREFSRLRPEEDLYIHIERIACHPITACQIYIFFFNFLISAVEFAGDLPELGRIHSWDV